MGDSGAATMEKLELLSSTASFLKQGLEGGGGASRVETPFLQNSPCSVDTYIAKPIFSVASATSVPGLLLRGTSPPMTTLKGNNSNSHLASPVSTDGEEEEKQMISTSTNSKTNVFNDSANAAASTHGSGSSSSSNNNNNLQDESRSPASTVDYSRRVSAPSPPFAFPLAPRYDGSLRPQGSIIGNNETSNNNSQPQPSSAFTSYPPPGNHSGIGPGGLYPPPHQLVGVDPGYFQQRQLPPLYNQQQQQQPQSRSYEEMVLEVERMREQLKEKDMVVSSLQHRVNHLENQINELRQLPTGKISHIPVDDMIRIMEEYGSEVSNQTLPQRKQNIKKASIVRQFRRWNPEFFRYFIHVNGEWVPKLGREGELRRRAEKRRALKQRAPPGGK